MSGLTVGSLFSGIGGLELGLERAGMEVRWQVEIDGYCRRVLAKHWPDVPRHEDVREVGAHNLEPVGLICGGFPCQDISNAGKKEGIDGARSGLWGEYVRIVRELRPRYVLVENVAALLTRGLERVLGDLAESGYDAEWDCIPAAAVGAPHRRDRLYLLAYSNEERLQKRRLHEERRTDVSDTPGRGRGGTRPRRHSLADPHLTRLEGQHDRPRPAVPSREVAANARTGAIGDGGCWWLSEPDVGRVADGVPARVDRLRALGNAVVPQVAEWIGRRIVEADALRESAA